MLGVGEHFAHYVSREEGYFLHVKIEDLQILVYKSPSGGAGGN